MTATRHRLHVSKITSIGAVESGDNDEADILIWKSAPESGGGDVLGSGSVSPVAALFAKVDRTLAMAAYQRSLTHVDANETQTRKETMTQPTMTAEEIAGAVADKAVALRSEPKFWDKSDAVLRVEIWKRTPGLRDAYTAAIRDPDGFAKSKSGEHAEALAILKRWKDNPGTRLS